MCNAKTQAHLVRLRDRLPATVPYARVVGKWIWIEFPTIPDPATRAALKDLGFHWSKRRGAWQNPCGFTGTGKSRRDPRAKYGEIEAEKELASC